MLKQKSKGSKRKLYHFNEFINDFIYYNFTDGTLHGFKGTMYTLDNPDKKKLEEVQQKYDNTHVSIAVHRYAPELKKICLFIAR